MLILKRRYEFWYSTIALHKLGATVIPATHLLTKKDIIYRCNAADIKMIVAAGEGIILQHIKEALPDVPRLKSWSVSVRKSRKASKISIKVSKMLLRLYVRAMRTLTTTSL